MMMMILASNDRVDFVVVLDSDLWSLDELDPRRSTSVSVILLMIQYPAIEPGQAWAMSIGHRETKPVAVANLVQLHPYSSLPHPLHPPLVV